jgi:fibronectin-binding autotransporter adhesin
VSSDVESAPGRGSIDATGYGVTGTLTWYGNTGFYLDGQANVTWYDSDIASDVLGTLASGNDGTGYSLSVEAGQRVPLDQRWSLTPQAQLAWSSVDFDDFTDRFGATVSLNDGDSLVGRLGLSADYENAWTDAAGQTSRAHLYGIANLYYDFEAQYDVAVSGISVLSDTQALWGGLGVGGSFDWANGKYSLYGEALARTSLEDFGDSHVLSGTVGFRMSW